MSEPDGGDGDATAGGGVAETPASGGGRGAAGTTRPLVLPEPYDGTGSWSEWSFHFENVATVNSWDDAQKLQWLRVRVTGRAQKALLRLQGATAATYEATRDALKARFDPESRRTRYQAEFQTRRKKAGEGWADFADELRSLSDKAYPELGEDARERLSINAYLMQLPQPQIAFSVRQKQPSTLDDAVTATLEMESYLSPQSLSAVDSVGGTDADTVAVVGQVAELTRAVERLTKQVEQLKQGEDDDGREGPARPRRGRRPFTGVCWNCRRTGHISRNCPDPPPQQQSGSQQQPGKLDSSSTTDHVSGGETPTVQLPIPISPVTGGYRLLGSLNGTPVTLLLDTGAAFTLLRQDVWNRIATCTSELKPWPGPPLVSAGGTPLTIHGRAHLTLHLGGRNMNTEMVVVSPLTSEAILGIDFLQAQRAIIDLDRGTLQLRQSGCDILLDPPTPTKSCTDTQQVRMADTVEIPPRAVMTVSAHLETPVEGVWLMEEVSTKQPHLAVGRAVVEPSSTDVPVCVLNVSDEPVTLYAGAVIATAQPVELPTGVNAADQGFSPQVDDAKIQLLVDGCSTNLSAGERDLFYGLLLKHADVLASSTADLGRTDKIHHRIDTGTAQPIRQPVRRISPHRREEVKVLLEQMLANGVVEPSSSPWASPVVLVRKKDGSMRFCIDFRKLNEVTRKDAYPLPRIDVTLDTLHGSNWFTTLDLLSGYWQVQLEETDKEKTAFSTPEGLYQFRVMPFGLCNAPASFQRLMDLVLSGLQWSQCLVYLDDIIVLGHSFETHIQNLDSVFKRLKEAGLRLKPSKCAFFRKEVKYLGHVISCQGVATDPEKVEKVATWPPPTSRREVQQFIGFANYYRRFIKDFAQVARPLHRLTERTSPFVWNNECQESFDQLRKRLCSAPVLAYPDFQRPFILDTDASDTGIGGVLSQVDDQGRERVIAYGSRLLTKPERKYCVTRRELLAVVTFVRQYRPYLICRKFTLRTDHGSLTWLRNFKEPEGQLARWLERLQELDFEIVHRRGSAHTNADSLSRLPCIQCGRDSHNAVSEIAATALQGPLIQPSDELRNQQLADRTLGPIIWGKEMGEKPDVGSFETARSTNTRRLLQIWDQLVLHQGVLCRRSKNPEGSGRLQIVVPDALQREVLSDLHEGAAGGHLGSDKTLGRLKERFYWPGHYNDVREWCRNCAVCASRKSPTSRPRAPLEPILVSHPLQLVACDIVGPFPESESGNSYILVVADYFTRYTEAYPLPNQEATTVAGKLVDEFFLRYSPPERLHSDQGRNFESAVVAEACRLLGVEKSRTTPYHPQSDGLVERFNRTLLDMLATAVGDQPFEWEQHLRRLCYAYNTSIHPTTGFSPFQLMFGRTARMPADITLGTTTSADATQPQYVTSLRTSLETMYGYVRENMERMQAKQKVRYDAKSQDRPFSIGDLVWLHSPAVPRGKSRKLHRPWTGPFRVVAKPSDSVYRLQHVQFRRKRPVVHFNRLKPCSPDTRLPQPQTPALRGEQPRPPAPPVGSGLELLDDDADSTSHEETEKNTPVPGPPTIPLPDINASPPTESLPVSSPRPPTPSAASASTQDSPQSTPPRRYPQRQRAAPARLYKTVQF